MKKRNLKVVACSVALVAVLSVGGTMAYFTDETSEVENIITMDNRIHGELEEPNYDEEKASSYVPGTLINKDPQIINDNNSIEAWVAVKVSISLENESITYDKFQSDYATVTSNGKEGFNTKDYELIGVNGNDRIYMYKSTLKPNERTNPIFDKVLINTGIKTTISSSNSGKKYYTQVTKSEYDKATVEKKTVDGKYYILTNVTTENYSSSNKYYVLKDGKLVESVVGRLPSFNIDVDGYMIQARNVDYDLAKEELLKLSGGTKLNNK